MTTFAEAARERFRYDDRGAADTVRQELAKANSTLVAADAALGARIDPLPKGMLGTATATAVQSGITTITDLTGLTVTVTVGTGRRIRVTAQVAVGQNTSTGLAEVGIYEGATRLQRIYLTMSAATNAKLIGWVDLLPSPGAHTYKLRGLTSAGTLTANTGTADDISSITVDDVGA